MKEKWKHCIPFASNLIDDGDRGSAPDTLQLAFTEDGRLCVSRWIKTPTHPRRS